MVGVKIIFFNKNNDNTQILWDTWGGGCLSNFV